MRIAQIMLAKRFGGAERSFVDISRALVARGHEVLAICQPGSQAAEKLRTAGVHCQPVRCFGSWDLLAKYTIKRRLASFNPELVHCHLARASHLGGAAAHSLGIPTVAKTHNLVQLKYYRHIDHLVPTTSAQVNHLERAGIDPARITRIPNFTAVTGRAPTANGAPPFRIAALGRYVRKKGFDLLIDAAWQLQADGIEFRVDIAGDGPERRPLEAQIQARGLSDCVRLNGWCDDAGEFLNDADLLVVPSRAEPFGIVVIEAMALKVPVLATRTQGPIEILDDACGYLCETDDHAMLASAIKNALHDQQRLDKVASAWRRYNSLYSESAVVSAYEMLYGQLIKP